MASINKSVFIHIESYSHLKKIHVLKFEIFYFMFCLSVFQSGGKTLDILLATSWPNKVCCIDCGISKEPSDM